MYDKSFVKIIEFLRDNPEKFSKSRSHSLFNEDDINALYGIYLSAKHQKIRLVEPRTIPDEAVSVLLKATFGYGDEALERIKREHQYSMAAENMVGYLLELYISTVMEKHGWIWCAGDFVRAVDFIKKNNNGMWDAVQIKNRDNTENSSSSAIRNGTDIKKWFRSYSRASVRRLSNTNWERFPEEEFRGSLSEEGFMNFIEEYIAS